MSLICQLTSKDIKHQLIIISDSINSGLKSERERHKQRETDRHRQRDTEIETGRQTDRDRQRQRQADRERQRETHREKQTDRLTDRQTENERNVLFNSATATTERGIAQLIA